MKRLRAALAALVTLLAPAVAQAGGALVYDTAGNAVGWDTTAPVPYRVDLGLLGAMDNGTATSLVDDVLSDWQAVPTAAIAYARVGALAEDVTVTNYGAYLGPYAGHSTPLGENAIAFDADGSIFDDLFGVGTGVIGFAGPTFFGDGVNPPVALGGAVAPGSHILEGFAFLNGRFVDGLQSNQEAAPIIFRAAVLHELGHFSGLGHTQIHALNGFERADGTRVGDATETETMYPFIARSEQATLAMDDRVALSRLYPDPSLDDATGCITGHILRSDGQPFDGANVVAISPQYPAESVSDVSGASAHPSHAGEYNLCGLVVGHAYAVEVQEIDVFASGGSRIGPFDPPLTLPGPPEAWNGPYEGSDPALDDPRQAVSINATIRTRTGVDVTLGVQRFRVLNLDWAPDGLTSDAAPAAIELGDFDSDGKLDLLGVQQGFAPGNELRLARGLGDGSFQQPAFVAAFPGNVAMVSGQFNPGIDSFLDVAVVSTSSKELRLYLGNGDGTFASPETLLAAVPAAKAVALAAGDLDGSGTQDLVVVRRESDDALTVVSEMSSGAGFAPISTPVPSSAGWHLMTAQSLIVGQFGGDAAADVVFMLTDQPTLAVLVGNGGGGFSPAVQSLAGISSRFGTALAAADFDGDGALDLAAPDYAPSGVAVPQLSSFIDMLRNDPLSGLQLRARYQVNEPLQGSLAVADFDRDGHADIASAGSFLNLGEPGAKLDIAYGDGAGGIRPVEAPTGDRATATIWGLAEFPAALYPGEMKAGDLNGDGRPDLVVSDHSTNVFGVQFPAQISVLLGQALPSERPLGFFTVAPCRLIDTRSGAPLADGVPRALQLAGSCAIPTTARSLSVNVTMINPTGGGVLQIRAGPLGPAPTAIVSAFGAGSTRANNALIGLSADGAGRIIVTASVANGGSVHLALDVNGYFQ